MGHGYSGRVVEPRTIKVELWAAPVVLKSSSPLQTHGQSAVSVCQVGGGSRRALLAEPLLHGEVAACAEPQGRGWDDDSRECHRDTIQRSFLCWECSSAFTLAVVDYRIEIAARAQSYALKLGSVRIELLCHFYSSTSLPSPLFWGPSMKSSCLFQLLLFPGTRGAALGMNQCGAMKEMLCSWSLFSCCRN